MEVLTYIVMIAALLSAMMVNANMQGRFLARGEGYLRSTAKSGFLGMLAAIALIAAYFGIGSLAMQLLG